LQKKEYSMNQNERSAKILAVLDNNWCGRAELAKRLGRPKTLNLTDCEALAVLEVKRLIEIDRRTDPRPAAVVYYYRLAQP
jgi:hypothetical protein